MFLVLIFEKERVILLFKGEANEREWGYSSGS